jgi:hypothetical protein
MMIDVGCSDTTIAALMGPDFSRPLWTTKGR